MKCTDCKYSVLIDYGYSNYTVEGTTIHCLLRKNRDFPVDRFYGVEPALEFAEKCLSFVRGDCVEVDVEWLYKDPSDYSSDPEIKELLEELFYYILNS